MERTKLSSAISQEDRRLMLGGSELSSIKINKHTDVEGLSRYKYDDIWKCSTDKRVLPQEADNVELVFFSEKDWKGFGVPKSVHLYGLDENYNVQSEIIFPKSASPVSSCLKYLRILRIEALDKVGDPAMCGDIQAKINGHVQAYIDPAEGCSEMSHFTVPAGHTAFVYSEYITSANTHILRKTYHPHLGSERISEVSDSPEMFTEKTDFWLTAKASPTSNALLYLKETIVLIED